MSKIDRYLSQFPFAGGAARTTLLDRLRANDYKIDETRQKLQDFAALTDVRQSWHEPDESDVTAVVKGSTLDNAFGDDPDSGEKVVELRWHGEALATINLATLLALATDPEYK